LIEGALRLDGMHALGAEIELARIAGIILLNVLNRLVDQGQRDFCRDRFPIRIARGYCQAAFFARLILLTIGFHIDCQELLHRRHDHLFRVDE
jgi:hypothetical protein